MRHLRFLKLSLYGRLRSGERWRVSRWSLLVMASGLLLACDPHHDSRSSLSQLSAQSVKPGFESLNASVFRPYCVECHSSPAEKNHYIDLSSYEAIVNSNVFPPLLVPGDPEQSSLYTATASGDMPKRWGRLPDWVVGTIAEWIDRGAPRVAREDDRDGEDGEDSEDPCPDGFCDPDCAPEEPGCGGENDDDDDNNNDDW